MRLIRARDMDKEQIDSFLMYHPQIDQQCLLVDGYVIKVGSEIIACFTLEQFEDQLYWLKQFYITKVEAVKLPILLESILALAKEQQAKKVFVNSHKRMIDIILAALQFCPQKEHKTLDKSVETTGQWWSYTISNV